MTKLRLGRGPARVASDNVARTVQDAIMASAETETIKLSRPRLRRMAAKIRVVANAELDKLMPVVVSLIERDLVSDMRGARGRTLRYQDLMAGAQFGLGFNPPNYYDVPPAWAPLEQNYLRRKLREKLNPDRMFYRTGALAHFLEGAGAAAIRRQTGGVRVETRTPKQVKGGFYLNEVHPEDAGHKDVPLSRSKTYQEIILGSITVKIFPNLNRSLLPGLATGRWVQSAPGGPLEQALFPGETQVLYDLVNKNRPYRTLLVPAMQFWALVRIPNAIFSSLSTHFKRAAPR